MLWPITHNTAACIELEQLHVGNTVQINFKASKTLSLNAYITYFHENHLVLVDTNIQFDLCPKKIT